MLILPLAFLTGCFAGPFGYDYYEYPDVAYNNIKDVLRKPPQIGRAKLDNDYVGLREVGERMSEGVSPTLGEPLLGGIRGSMNGGVDGSVGYDELNDGLGAASEVRDELGGNVQSKDGLASDYVGGVSNSNSGGGGFSDSELNDDGSLRGGGDSFDGGNSVDGDSNVGGVDGGLDGVADNAGADYAEADANDYLDLDKYGISGLSGISEQMGGGFKPIQHQSQLKMSKQIPEFGGDYADEDIPDYADDDIPANKLNYIQHQSILKMNKQIPDQSIRMKQINEAPEFGDDYADYADYADEEIPANNNLSYLGLIDGLHIQKAGPNNGQDYGQDYADYDDYADYADEEIPANNNLSYL